ncbi:MAG TPA: hypothetical protein VFQ43_03345 [Nitrososphaera sp.]|nr:hypothetical protein [Nitrososphaera sp.]
MATSTDKSEVRGKITNAKPIPHIPLPFKEVIADVLKVKPPERNPRRIKRKKPSGQAAG